jgi:tetratricopeptide (TPR) repeat protein
MSLAEDRLGAMRERLIAAQADFTAGRIGEAAVSYRAIVEEIPDQPDALHMLGVIAYRMGKTELALQLFDEALRAVPTFAQAWSNRALILRLQGRRAEALQSGRRAIACDSKLADGWDITGLLLRERFCYQAACQHHARAAVLNPNNQNVQNNYAVALAVLGRYTEAYRAARKALFLNPSFAAAELTVANILNEAGWPERAIIHYQKATALDPSMTESVASEGRSLMLIGEMKEGWAKMETRGYKKERFTALPRWNGGKVGHLLLYAEQGAGDVIQFLRYIPFIRDRAATLSLDVPAWLQGLVAAHLPDAHVLTPDDPLPAADAYELLMSLPHRCGTTLDTIPTSIPYIKAEESWRDPWRAKLASLPKPRMGIVWMGNPRHGKDYNRSLGFEEIRPLFDAVRPHLISMQKGSTTAATSNAGIFDADPWLPDFSATCGLIAELDLVIAVDTGVAHLAGAMGKPVWVLLPFMPDWRWMLEREDSSWYPGMRLFRQRAPKDWAPVVARVIGELRKFLAGDRSVLSPPVWDGKIIKEHPNAVALSEELSPL